MVFQVVGRSTVLQNDQAVTLDLGDVVLVDSTRPVTYVNDAYAQWLSLNLPRRSLMSYLGVEPQGGSVGRHGTRGGRLLFQLIFDEFRDELTSTPASVYMQLAVYDLIGEIFTPSDSKSVSPYADKQFGRVRAIIKDRFADPDLGPRESRPSGNFEAFHSATKASASATSAWASIRRAPSRASSVRGSSIASG